LRTEEDLSAYRNGKRCFQGFDNPIIGGRGQGARTRTRKPFYHQVRISENGFKNFLAMIYIKYLNIVYGPYTNQNC